MPTASDIAEDPHQVLLERRRHGEDAGGPLDLRGARLIGADLAGLDLAASDLSGADLSRANLRDTNLLGARLRGATLFEADLTDAELTGAELAASNLSGATLVRAGLGMADLRAATLDRADLSGATLTHANLSDAHLQMTVLERVRAREAELRSTYLVGADLHLAELDGSDVTGAILDGANLRGASIANLVGYRRASWVGVDLREIDFTGAYLCRRFVLDQNFIAEFRAQGRLAECIYQLWRATSDCGRSAIRWSFCTGLLVVLFAWLYTLVGVDYGPYSTMLSPLYFSVVTMTTLGFGDVLPSSVGGQLVAMTQVIVGYVMLGGLLSILSSKMASRAN